MEPIDGAAPAPARQSVELNPHKVREALDLIRSLRDAAHHRGVWHSIAAKELAAARTPQHEGSPLHGFDQEGLLHRMREAFDEAVVWHAALEHLLRCLDPEAA